MLLIRADASATIGVGHAMRCLALAEAWLDSGDEVTFAMAEVPPLVAQRIERTGARIEKLANAGDTGTVDASHAVLDGYHLGESVQRALADKAPLLVLDDRGETATVAASYVLNPNPYATAAMYQHLPAAQLLIGRDYALLRREFREPMPARAVPAVARRILVSFGGADPANLTERVLDALHGVDGAEVTALVGPANSRSAALRTRYPAADLRDATDNMAELLRGFDLAMIAAGGTTWEAASLGIPLIVVPVADNQLDVAATVATSELGIALRSDASIEELRDAAMTLMHDVQRRRAMSARGPQLIDGKGALRACTALRSGAQV